VAANAIPAALNLPLGVQWQFHPAGTTQFTDIAGATGSSLVISNATAATHSGVYRAVVSVAGKAVNSAEVNVDVVADTAPPRVVEAKATGAQSILVSFDEAIDATTLGAAANYTLSGGLTISSATAGPGGTSVLLATGAPVVEGTQYTLTVNALKDLFGNTIPAGTTFQFGGQIVTYKSLILADGPVALFGFEETGGGVATNSVPGGVHGAYYTGDETAAGEGGTPSTAKGDAGPRPPGFVGFAPDNRAATFGGAETQDWVDTKVPYLQGLGAFTLEYWVKPTDRQNQGTRIGIVGQNDAIEYGFISPTTIQIWTPNGGALDTPYSFADN
jgi:hypothetical protein